MTEHSTPSSFLEMEIICDCCGHNVDARIFVNKDQQVKMFAYPCRECTDDVVMEEYRIRLARQKTYCNKEMRRIDVTT